MLCAEPARLGALSGGVFKYDLDAAEGTASQGKVCRDLCAVLWATAHMPSASQGAVGEGWELAERKKTRKMIPDHSARLARPQCDACGGFTTLCVVPDCKRFYYYEIQAILLPREERGNKSCLAQGWRRS
jgi:hypothetical protein